MTLRGLNLFEQLNHNRAGGPWWKFAFKVEQSHMEVADCMGMLSDTDEKHCEDTARFIAFCGTHGDLLLDLWKAAKDVDAHNLIIAAMNEKIDLREVGQVSLQNRYKRLREVIDRLEEAECVNDY